MECPFQVLKASIHKEKAHKIHTDADAFICVVMSHGNSQGILRTSDWQQLDSRQDIVAEFDGESWPVMIGKPKIFLFQMCRGG